MTEQNFDLGSSQASAEAVRHRLDGDIIGWLGTTRPDGRPHCVPVWFLWQDGRAVVFSEPETVKVRNLRDSPQALIHLHTDRSGDGVVVLEGTAVISDRTATEWLPSIGAAYTAKYAEAMEAFGMGLAAIAERFSTVIVLTPKSLTAW